LVLPATAATALECPISHPVAGQDALKETPAMIAALSDRLAQGGAAAAPDIVSGLRARHPSATNGEIVNYLITAYCPAINRRQDLTEAQKHTDMMDFDQAVLKLIYRSTR
jgi:hypothetical protein